MLDISVLRLECDVFCFDCGFDSFGFKIFKEEVLVVLLWVWFKDSVFILFCFD